MISLESDERLSSANNQNEHCCDTVNIFYFCKKHNLITNCLSWVNINIFDDTHAFATNLFP